MARKVNSDEIQYTRTMYLRAHKKDTYIANIRESRLENSARTECKPVTRTLSICRKDENFYIQVSDVMIGTPLKALNVKECAQMAYRKYLAAIGALVHNANFIRTAQLYGEPIKNGKPISLRQIKADNFQYDLNVLDAYSHQKISHPIKREKDFETAFAKVLKDSQKFVEEAEAGVIEFKDKIPEFDKLTQLKDKWVQDSTLLILALKLGKIDFSQFAKDVCFEDLESPFMHR